MNSNLLRRCSIALVSVALVSNIVLDLLAYRQALATRGTDQWVKTRFYVGNQLDQISTLYNQLLQEASTLRSQLTIEQTLVKIVKSLQNLAALESGYPDQVSSIQAFSHDLIPDRQTPNSRLILTQAFRTNLDLRKIRARETDLLRERLTKDEHNGTHSRIELIWGSILDTGLIVFLSLLFWLDHRSRRETERTLQATIADLYAANDGLANINRTRVESFKSAVHDLKNPLGSIRGFADLIADESENKESVVEMSVVIQRISRQTLEIINSLIERPMEESDLQIVNAEIFPLKWALDSVKDDLQPQILRKRQKLRIQGPADSLYINGSRAQIREVILNLVENAVKYSPYGGVIDVRLSQKERFAKIEVEDQGPGLTAEDKKKVFGKYQKLSAQPTGGELSTGVGLYFVKQLVELYHGTISVTDASTGQGACFTVELPLAKLLFASRESLEG